VCCATTAREPLFAAADLPERVHVNAIGSFRPSMRELPDDLLACGSVVVDDREAILVESGEILHAVATGALVADSLVELGDALGRDVELLPRTVFKSVGVAVQDWAIAQLLARTFLG
jgi:ornithine cyclodeaminase